MGSPSVAPYGAYRTGDRQTVIIGTTNDREWERDFGFDETAVRDLRGAGAIGPAYQRERD